MHTNGKGKMFYVMCNTRTQESLFIEFDVEKFIFTNIANNKSDQVQCEIAYPFAVDQKGMHTIWMPNTSTLERVIVPFKIVYSNDFPAEITGFKDSSGISVYDYKLKQLWTHEFQDTFLVT